jgi:hypothetical protein
VAGLGLEADNLVVLLLICLTLGLLHRQNTSPADYAGALPAQLLYLGLLVAPLIVTARTPAHLSQPLQLPVP